MQVGQQHVEVIEENEEQENVVGQQQVGVISKAEEQQEQVGKEMGSKEKMESVWKTKVG